MDESSQFAETELGAVPCEETWHDSYDVKDQEALDVLHPVLVEFNLFLIGLELEKVEDDVHCKANIDK